MTINNRRVEVAVLSYVEVVVLRYVMMYIMLWVTLIVVLYFGEKLNSFLVKAAFNRLWLKADKWVVSSCNTLHIKRRTLNSAFSVRMNHCETHLMVTPKVIDSEGFRMAISLGILSDKKQ